MRNWGSEDPDKSPLTSDLWPSTLISPFSLPLCVLSCPQITSFSCISLSWRRMKPQVCARTHMHVWRRDVLLLNPFPGASTGSIRLKKKKRDQLRNVSFFVCKCQNVKRKAVAAAEWRSQCWAVRFSSLLLSTVLCCFRYSIRSACFSTTSSKLEPSLWPE